MLIVEHIDYYGTLYNITLVMLVFLQCLYTCPETNILFRLHYLFIMSNAITRDITVNNINLSATQSDRVQQS